jgi:hypothetical protein
VTINLSAPIAYFGFYYGSPDAYNRIEFYSGATLVQAFHGQDLINPADGAWTRGEFVNFAISGGTVSRIVMSSTSAAFETDNHALTAASPEPLSIILTASGLLLAGCLRRFRRQ